MHTAKEFYTDWPAVMGDMKSQAPGIANGFGAMYQTLMGEGALTVREKELIAIGIAMAIRCERCIFSHAEKARTVGITRDELLELAGVVVTMQGGPGYVHVPTLIEAMDAQGI